MKINNSSRTTMSNSVCQSQIISNQPSLSKVDSTQYLETRHGNKYLKAKELSYEQIEENEIILEIKNELHEFFRIDIVYCKDKILNLIRQIRKHKWSSIHEITDDYLIDIDRYELLKANQVNGVKVQSSHAQTLKEDLLKNKYNVSIEQFRIEHTHNIPYNQGSYDLKKQFKNNLLAGITNYSIKQVNRKGRKGQIIGDIEDWHKEYDDMYDEYYDEQKQLENEQEIEERKQDELFEEFLLRYLGTEFQTDQKENEKELSQDSNKKENNLQDYERELSQETTAVPQIMSYSSASPTIAECQNHDKKDGGDSMRKQEKDKSFNKRKSQMTENTNHTSSSSNSNENCNNLSKKTQEQEIPMKKKIFLSEDSSEEEDQMKLKSASSNSSDSDLDFQWMHQGRVATKIQVELPEKEFQSCLQGGFNKKRHSQNNSQTAVSNFECIALIDEDDEDDWEDDKKFNNRSINLNAQSYKKLKCNVI